MVDLELGVNCQMWMMLGTEQDPLQRQYGLLAPHYHSSPNNASFKEITEAPGSLSSWNFFTLSSKCEGEILSVVPDLSCFLYCSTPPTMARKHTCPKVLQWCSQTKKQFSELNMIMVSNT